MRINDISGYDKKKTEWLRNALEDFCKENCEAYTDPADGGTDTLCNGCALEDFMCFLNDGWTLSAWAETIKENEAVE